MTFARKLMAASAADTPVALIFSAGSSTQGGVKVLDPKSYEDVTSLYVPANAPTLGAAGGNEKIQRPYTQDGERSQFIGMGCWARNDEPNGAVIDVSQSPWVYTTDFGLNVGSSGNSSVNTVAPLPGARAAMQSPGGPDSGVFYVNTKSEIAGQPSAFSASITGLFSGSVFLAGKDGTMLRVFDASSPVLSFLSQYATSTGSTAIAFSPDGTKLASSLSNNEMGIFSSLPDISVGPEVVISAPSGATNVEFAKWSPDGRYLLFMGQKNSVYPYCFVAVADARNGYEVLDLSVPDPLSTTNCRFTGGDWYPNSKDYIVAGYANAVSHVGSVYGGGFYKNLRQDGEITSSAYGAVVL